MVWVLRVFIVLFALLLVVCGYLSWRVHTAKANTVALLAEAVPLPGEPLASLPPEWVNALITVEDPTFWDNDGTDFHSPGAGITTITQGLSKQLYFERFAPGLRKIELIVLAKFALTPTASKEEILNTFLNVAYMGHKDGEGIYGFETAAEAYYGRPLTRLSQREFLSLVAMAPAPNRLQPDRHPEANAARVARIERLLIGVCTPIDLQDVWLEGCAAPAP